MQRAGSAVGEILVALVVLAVVGVAFVAALVLASAERAGTRATATSVAQQATVSAPIIILPTRTATPSSTPTATATAPPLATASRTPPPTATRTPRASATPLPTATRTPRATAAPTDTASPSATATRTPRPTATRTLTPTLTPSSTATPTATRTPRPTATRTLTPTATPSSTVTPTATHTATPTATLTATLTSSPTPSLTPTGQCGPPAGWVQYTIQRGDTLSGLSVRYRTTIGALRQANCLTGDVIYAGRLLWVPNVTPRATPTPVSPSTVPGVNPTTAVVADPCSNSAARITAPRYGARVTGPFWVEGAADTPSFARYEIELRRDGTSEWMNQGTYFAPVTSGHLARIDPAQFGSGAFWIRLTVVDTTSNYPPPCAILVMFP